MKDLKVGDRVLEINTPENVNPHIGYIEKINSNNGRCLVRSLNEENEPSSLTLLQSLDDFIKVPESIKPIKNRLDLLYSHEEQETQMEKLFVFLKNPRNYIKSGFTEEEWDE